MLIKTRLGDEATDAAPIRGEAAVSLVLALTLESWALAGREVPTYTRAETPYRFVRDTEP